MRNVRRWQDGEFSPQRPLCFDGWPEERERPGTFQWEPGEFELPAEPSAARLDYRAGWTALIFWNGSFYFTDEILTFDEMITLVRARFPEKFHLVAPIVRDYVD